MLKSKFNQVKLIANKENAGFGKANNQGAAKAKGDWVLLLNSDTVIKEGFFQGIASAIDQQKTGIYGFKLLNQDGSIQPSAGYFPSLGRIFTQMFFWDDLPLVKKIYRPYQQNDSSFYLKIQDVDWVTGACLLIPKKVFEQVNGFDEFIFMYGEEVDLCYRLKKNGLKVKYLPSPEIYNLKGASSTDGFRAAVVGEYRGLITFYQKHYPAQLFGLKIILALGALLRICLFAMIKPGKVIAYKQALKELLIINKYES